MNEAQKDKVQRRHFLKTSTAAALGLAFVGDNLSAIAGGSPQTRTPLPAVHNMLIIGMKTIFLYHLPMFSYKGFDSPHRYQVIIEATFRAEGRDLQTTYFADRDRNKGFSFYTLNPEKFVLTELRDGSRKSFKGTIFRGHLEKPSGTRIELNGVKEVEVDVQKLIYFKELIPNARTSLRQIEYILFGSELELFMVHQLTKPGDFDQILSIEDQGQQFSASTKKMKLDPYRQVLFPAGNSILQRIKAGQQIRGAMRPVGLEIVTTPRLSLNLRAKEEIYLEEGELRTPPEFAPTSTERAAGFP
jgi:hypothetical protein